MKKYSLRTSSGSRRRRGSSLLAAGVFVLVLSAGVALMINQTTSQMTNLYRTRVVENSLAGANAVLSCMSADIQFVMNNRPPQTGGRMDQINGIVNAMRPASFYGYQPVKNSNKDVVYVRSIGPNDLQFRTIDDPADQWDGYSTGRLDYELVAAVRENSANADKLGVEGIAARKRVTLDYVPLYQFAIFYNPDMELHPGPVMDVRGPVHCNGTLWLGAQSGLNFWGRVSAVGKIRAYNDFTNMNINAGKKDAGYTYPLESYTNQGDVKFKNAAGSWLNMFVGTGSSLDTNNNKYLDGLDLNWQNDALSRWGGIVRDQAHGTRTINPPLPVGSEASDMIARLQPGDSQAVQELKFESMADLKITGNPGNPDTIKIVDSNGNVIPNTDAAGKNPIWTIGEFYDGQQETVVRTIDIDMSKIVSRGFNFQNGVLYASTTPAAGDNWTSPQNWAGYGREDFMPAIRVTNSATVPRNLQSGFTFATDRPLYTVGNINSTSKATAVFAADAVTVTSQELKLDYPVSIKVGNKWEVRSSLDNSKSFPLTSGVPNGYTREGTPSGVKDPITNASVSNSVNPAAKPPSGNDGLITNLIMVMGQTGSRFNDAGKRITQSGGAHNVMRYLENWGGKKHTFNGSLICLYESLVSTLPWRNDSGHAYYSPPNRNYQWDNSLQAATPPPGMPMFLVINDSAVERVSLTYAKTHQP